MATASLDEETAKKVLRQVEFYFSDSNLPRDNFLKKLISESEDGMVNLALICSFSRMKSHLGLGDAKPDNVSEDAVKAVAEVLRKSASLKISEDGKKVGRTTELLKPEEVIEQVDIRTIAAGPLEYDVKLEDVESFFGQSGKVNSVRLPRHVADKRFFCGTALIEFSTEEDAENVLKKKLVYAGAELELKPKKEFDAERAKMLEEFESSRSSTGPNSRNTSSLNSDYPKGLIVAFKLKSMSTGESVGKNGIQETKDNNGDAFKLGNKSDSAVNAPEESEKVVSESVEDIKKESINNTEEVRREKVDEETMEECEVKETEEAVHESEEGSPEDSCQERQDKATVGDKNKAALYKDNMDVVLREDLKDVFQRFGTVKFVDYRIGEDSGYIRFEEPEEAQKARAAAVLIEEGGLIVKNYIAMLEPVTGEAEKEYWSLLRGNKDRFRGNRGNRGRGGRFNKGGRHFGGKHSRSKENDSTVSRPNKAQKVAAA
ncbi:la protein 1-like [Telopea speciosissima]|uniref:la protein 1-like n=1 Tax=Telopea speciosissima TaxID=54955 RepID=UPI001CC7859A|nr:la protein 1-like [Telopea speciosissima]